MKYGTMKDVFVYDENNGPMTQCMCIQADEDGSIPFELGKRIKEAICGDVYTGFRLQSQENHVYSRKELVVIKAINLHKLEQLKRKGNMQEDPIKEISILQMFDDNCKNVCSQIECIQDEKYIYSIMKYYGEEMFNLAGRVTEDECRNYFRQIIEGVKTLQRHDVCHRDLSLENILISSEGECTIIDFGMSLVYPTAPPSSLNSIIQSLPNNTKVVPDTHSSFSENDGKHVLLIPPQGTCGKKNYIAPEILSNLQPFNGAMVDNWSLGIIFFMLMTGIPPFQQASALNKWYKMVQQGKIREMLTIFKIEPLSDLSVDLMQKLLTGSSCQTRMSTDDILLHPWFTSTPNNAEESCSEA
jgi:serine/threonine protein kinase